VEFSKKGCSVISAEVVASGGTRKLKHFYEAMVAGLSIQLDASFLSTYNRYRYYPFGLQICFCNKMQKGE